MNPLEYAKQIAYSSNETLRFTYDMACLYQDKPGVYVECGVAAGAQIIAMAYGAPNKVIYAFDSFEGIPLPSNRDDQMPGIMMLTETERKALPDPGKQRLESSGATSVSENDFWLNIDNAFGGVLSFPRGEELKYVNVITIKGWFENTTKDFKHDIAILRLDGDLYNSTYVCLKNLYPKVIEGGIVIIDDWQLKGCRDACHDYFLETGVIDWHLKIKYISNIAYFYK